MTAVLRTPDERFHHLVDFAYQPRYMEDLPQFEGLRLHYVDEGPMEAETTFVCLHGEPTWAYLYRHMLPVFLERGHRVVAPDLFGFGRSDKPVDDACYTFVFHRDTLLAFLDRLSLTNATLVVQDWGGLLGLTLPMARPDTVRCLLVMNTTLACGEGSPSPGFTEWRSFMANQPDLDVGGLMRRAVEGLDELSAAAYDAPFPDRRYKAGVRRFPAIVPTETDMPGAALSRQARDWYRHHWQGQTFMAVGMRDPVLGPQVMRQLHQWMPGSTEPLAIEEGGHFVQEHGEQIAVRACEYFDL